MKYSAKPAHKNMDNVYEIKCPHNRLGDVYDYFKEHSDKRCNIVLEGAEIPERFFEQVDLLKERCEKYTISCTNFGVMNHILEHGYNAYFDYPITDWEMFDTLQKIGVSDITIDGPLGFQMDKIKLGKKDTIIRVSPCASANASLSLSENANSFFIRPEDMHLYEDAIDIIDFRAPNTDTEKVLLDIYSRGSFDFNLNLLVKHLNMDVENPFIDSSKFAQARLNCGQRCKIPGRACHMCSTQFKLTNLILNYVKNRN